MSVRTDQLVSKLQLTLDRYSSTKQIEDLAEIILACDNLETELSGLKHWATFTLVNKMKKGSNEKNN